MKTKGKKKRQIEKTKIRKFLKIKLNFMFYSTFSFSFFFSFFLGGMRSIIEIIHSLDVYKHMSLFDMRLLANLSSNTYWKERI